MGYSVSLSLLIPKLFRSVQRGNSGILLAKMASIANEMLLRDSQRLLERRADTKRLRLNYMLL
jgi:hypothetical protein